MAVVKHAQITWKGDSGFPPGDETTSIITAITTAAALDSFGVSMATHTKCNFAYRHAIWSRDMTPAAPGVGANTDTKAVIYFRHPTTSEILSFCYPSPIDADVEETQYGKRIKESAVVIIVGLLSTLSGISYIPLHGVYYQQV